MKICLTGITLAFIYGTSSAESVPISSVGFEIMISRQSGNCVACHELPRVEGIVSNVGPSLQGVGSRWNRATLIQWVKDARVIKPQTLMPPFGTTGNLTKANPPRAILSDAQIEQVVDTLQTWK